MTSDYRVDRILQEDEVRQLENLLSPMFSEDYPNFLFWLKNVQEEILDGNKKRFAIGIWKERLIATSIVKITASGVAELKSFFVDSGFQLHGYSNDLYEEVESQCRKSGISRILSYLYTDNKNMIEFLISKGFVISGKDDLYGNKRESYILSKTITPKYCGDRYDWENIGEWYLNLIMNAVKIEDHPVVANRSFDRHMRIKTGSFQLDALVEIKDEDVDSDDVEILHSHCMKSHYHLPIFVARSFKKRAIKFAQENGVIIFSSDDIAKTVGWRPPIFCEGPIKGMVVSIKPEFLQRLFDGKSPYFYVKGGPIGKKLQKGQLLVFYSTDPEKSVNAIGEIKSICLGTPQEIWNRFGKNLVLTKDEYFRFSAIKQNIVAIELKKIEKIKPIKDKQLDSIIPKKDRSGSYIDEKTLSNIIGH